MEDMSQAWFPQPHHGFIGDPDRSLSLSGSWFPSLSKEDDPQTVS